MLTETHPCRWSFGKQPPCPAVDRIDDTTGGFPGMPGGYLSGGGTYARVKIGHTAIVFVI
ncbi:hypothetical protein SBRY_80105 [Actinacidiphila bryophytorum]|uniref:Uncharacterized protein n=1 Tax=Actinacidiphila bryophytorum TaxID=1436133 RepID=A0A9W4H7Y7_9ACTN|nr:hypothetical protein SBRY_80105 [Actinacidiphila bryophytorum]